MSELLYRTPSLPPGTRIKYRSRLARILLPKRFRAITLGATIHCQYSAMHPFTLVHEIEHLKQIRERGRLSFYLSWLLETFRFGYTGNKWENAADVAAHAWWNSERERVAREHGVKLEWPPNPPME
jgi:hypothetical protein